MIDGCPSTKFFMQTKREMVQGEKIEFRRIKWEKMEKKKVERPRETEKGRYSKVSIHPPPPQSNPTPPESRAWFLAVSQLTFTACLLFLWLFSSPGVTASSRLCAITLPQTYEGWKCETELGLGRPFPQIPWVSHDFKFDVERLLNCDWQPVTWLEGNWPLRGTVTTAM